MSAERIAGEINRPARIRFLRERPSCKAGIWTAIVSAGRAPIEQGYGIAFAVDADGAAFVAVGPNGGALPIRPCAPKRAVRVSACGIGDERGDSARLPRQTKAI